MSNNNSPINNLNERSYILNHKGELSFWHHELMMFQVIVNKKVDCTSVDAKIRDCLNIVHVQHKPMEVRSIPDHIDEDSISDWLEGLFE